jgi:hypothetical protein
LCQLSGRRRLAVIAILIQEKESFTRSITECDRFFTLTQHLVIVLAGMQRGAATRDAMLCELRRLLEQSGREPHQIKSNRAVTFELRLVVSD